MKKKALVVLSLLLVALVAFSACGGGSENSVAGKYTLTEGKQGDLTITAEQLKDIMGMESTMELTEDGKVTINMNMNGSDMSAEGTYTVDGDTINLDADGAATEGKIEDGKIVIESSGVTLYYEK